MTAHSNHRQYLNASLKISIKARNITAVTINAPILNSLTVPVLWNLFVILFSLEPAYQDILYGSAWKVITINPSPEYTDVGDVQQKVQLYVQKSKFWLDGEKIDYLACYAHNTLMYSLTNREPLSFTKTVSGYRVSVPFVIGYTYHCEMSTTTTTTIKHEDSTMARWHYITASTIQGDEDHDRIFILSHTFFSFRRKQFDLFSWLSHSQQVMDDCKKLKREMPSMLYILSSLSKSRDGYSPLCQVRSQLQQIQNSTRRDCQKEVAITAHDGDRNMSYVQTRHLDVMSYNIWNFNPYNNHDVYSHRISRLAKLLSRTDPDVIGLQEVRMEASRGGPMGPYQIDHLMPYLDNYQFVYQPAQLFESSLNEGRSEEGVAILSKHPILYHDYLLLYRNSSNSADGHQRVCLHAVIDVPNIGQVHVFNTHYSLSHEAREEASKQILQFMSIYEGPAFLLGDLNASPDEQGVRILVKDSSLLDVWSLLRDNKYNDGDDDDPGYTFNTLESKLSKRIDYILMRQWPGVDVTDVKVMDDNARSNITSDHRALLAKFSFKSCV